MRLYHETVIISIASPIYSDHYFCANSDRKSIEKHKREKHREKHREKLRQFRFAESVTLMTAEREGAKAFHGARNHTIFVL